MIRDAMQHTARGSIVCLAGVSPSRTLSVDVGALNNELVLEKGDDDVKVVVDFDG